MPQTGSSQAAYQQFAHLDSEQVLNQLSSKMTGLSKNEAATRSEHHGPNTLNLKQPSWLNIWLRQFKSPFVYILIVASILAYGLGEMIDGTMILIFIMLSAVLGFYQEFRSEQALKFLNQFTTPQADVIRDDELQQIPTSDLVPGDIIKLQPGDIVPADIRLLQTTQLTIDESVLTGESDPCKKTEAALSNTEPAIHEAHNVAFAGSTVLHGQATGIVIATGTQAYMGSIAKLTVETNRVSSFEKGMNKFSNFILKLVSVTLILVFLANILIKGPTVSIGEWILFIIALAAAVIPEALPLVITFSLSRGAMRLSKHKVVVKRLSAIEDLGGIEILCTDKTGTITENKLVVSNILGDQNEVLFQAAAAIFHKAGQNDPFDIAIEEKYQESSTSKSPITLLEELPFDPERKRNSVLIKHHDQQLLIVRGAAEAILPHLKNDSSKEIRAWTEAEEEKGRRIIVVAHKVLATSAKYDKKAEESQLVFTGAISFADPLKKTAIAAVKKAEKLGVDIKIITGDSVRVARHIAIQVGLIESDSEVITANEFFALPSEQQADMALKIKVFARFSPSQKYQLIELLQQSKEVGFLGEGINDAPALKIANVAVVVDGASDIAREAADVILLNPSLNVIINGIQEGREVFANTIKYIKMTLASNFGNFYAIAVVTLFINFLPMLPIQILLVNLLSDFPLIAVATDSVDPETIKKPEKYNIKDFVIITAVFGTLSSAFDFIFFATFFRISPEVLQTYWFIGSILTELVLLYSLRTHLPFFKAKMPSKTIIILTFLAAAITILIPYTAFGQSVFSFVRPTLTHLGIVMAIVVTYFVSNEILKFIYYRFLNGRSIAAAG